jgi:ADP-ribose pyrophosphatase YjhB (NUDIX family)
MLPVNRARPRRPPSDRAPSHPSPGYGPPGSVSGVSTDVETWLGWSRELHSIAQAGLTYSESAFDRQRYQRLREITAELTAALVDAPPDPVRLAVTGETGYLTPKLDVRAAVFDGSGRLLMVREVVDGRWALPGGWADVNEGLLSGSVREVREESGYLVEAVRLLGIYDKRHWGSPPAPTFTLTSVVECRLLGGEATTSTETTAIGWFGRDELPDLSTGRTAAPLLARVFAHHDDPSLPQDLT